MLYITGMQALNISCSLNTTGDWHKSCMDWKHLHLRESSRSLWGNWGIEGPKSVPQNNEKYFVANHLRALLDMLYEQNFVDARGLKNDYICTEEYNNMFFRQVAKMQDLPYWTKIDEFMKKEFFFKWINFMEVYHHELRRA